jgi:hypothetical protein
MQDKESETTDTNEHKADDKKEPKETGKPPIPAAGVLQKGTSETLAGAHAKGVGHVHHWWQFWR